MNKSCTTCNCKENLKGAFKSYWLDSSSKTNYPILHENINVDITVIGAGIVGITTSLLLKNQGFKVALIDADRIAQGTSGHTTAKITSQHHLIYHKLINEIGKENAKLYANANESAIDFIENTIHEYSIDCDFHRLPAYIYTKDEKFVPSIKKEADSAASLGLKAKFLDSIPLPLSVKAALCFENQAQFHPRKYLLHLASKISGEGSNIFENTKIVDITEEDECICTTDNDQTISSSKIIIASHFPCYDNLGLYFARLSPKRSYVLALESKEDFPEGMFINAEEPGRSLRCVNCKNSKIILVGGEGHKTGHGENTLTHYKNLKSFAKEAVNTENILYYWSTQDYITLDGIPYIGNLTSTTENIYVATGFGEWGMTNGTAAAILLKDLIIKKENPWENLYNPSRAMSSVSVKNLFKENIDVAKELIKGKLGSAPNNVHLNNDEGKVVTIQGRKYGAYKDNMGTIHLVDNTCTHLGCELKWNDAEKSWDCPCHGSRFSYEGDIIEGPAINKLNHYKESPNKINPNIF
ncbi:FAD-dependent oxidoreductase [Clostridium sp. Marseille-Q2269]|uniref:FAD-dependent oxidoreductase n=1 Tax=Clostridium sp. Marseille-Q2269 TaxID=2942205 RepID=UPI002073484A|nr:FAD-dependent oxidoreductase [Clostridium sp. Marseille-Q2269]